MSCQSVQEQISLLLDGLLVETERDGVAAHLRACPACDARFQSMQSMRAALRTLDEAPLPAALALRLQVLASHERLRMRSRASLASFVDFWSGRAELLFENMMRPLALPFAGGLLSAMLLFGMLVPNLSFRHNFSDDRQLATASAPDGRLVESLPAPGSPTWLWKGDSPRLESADFVASDDETVLELTIDETGRVADYSISRGRLTPEMQNLILWSQFTPATFNGRNIPGKIRISFHGRRNVRG